MTASLAVLWQSAYEFGRAVGGLVFYVLLAAVFVVAAIWLWRRQRR